MREAPAEVGGGGGVPDERAAEVSRPVGRGDDGSQGELRAVEAFDDLGECADGGGAPGLELGEQRPLGGGAGAGVVVVEQGDEGCRVRVVRADLHRERPLAGGREHLDRVEQLADGVDPSEATQACGGEHDGVEVSLGDLPHPGVDVAAQSGDDEAEAQGLELGPAAGGARAHGRARRQLTEREPAPGDEGVAGVLAHRDRGHERVRVGCRGQVLQRVHGQVDPPVDQGGAQGGDEDAGAAELGQRGGLVAIALGADLDELDLVAERAQLVGHPRRLGRREGGSAGSEAEHAQSSSGRVGGADTRETSRGSRSNSSLSARA